MDADTLRAMAKAQRAFAYNEMGKAARLKAAGFDGLAKVYEDGARLHFNEAKRLEQQAREADEKS